MITQTTTPLLDQCHLHVITHLCKCFRPFEEGTGLLLNKLCKVERAHNEMYRNTYTPNLSGYITCTDVAIESEVSHVRIVLPDAKRVYNLYACEVGNGGESRINMEALEQALNHLKTHATQYFFAMKGISNINIGIPVHMGIFMDTKTWNEVQDLIDTVFQKDHPDVTYNIHIGPLVAPREAFPVEPKVTTCPWIMSTYDGGALTGV